MDGQRRRTHGEADEGRRGETLLGARHKHDPGDQHVPQAGREGAEDTLRGHRKATVECGSEGLGEVSTPAHRVGRRSALTAKPTAISGLHTFDRSKV